MSEDGGWVGPGVLSRAENGRSLDYARPFSWVWRGTGSPPHPSEYPTLTTEVGRGARRTGPAESPTELMQARKALHHPPRVRLCAALRPFLTGSSPRATPGVPLGKCPGYGRARAHRTRLDRGRPTHRAGLRRRALGIGAQSAKQIRGFCWPAGSPSSKPSSTAQPSTTGSNAMRTYNAKPAEAHADAGQRGRPRGP